MEKEVEELKNMKDALFDFDDEIDQLSEVSDRYPIDMFSKRIAVEDEEPLVEEE